MERNLKVRIIPRKEKLNQLKRVGIYARVSTAGKAQLQSLAVQVSALTRNIYYRNDCLLRDVYMDVGSAKTGEDRREFTRLLFDCQNDNLDYVITKSLSRFGRDTMEVVEAVRKLKDSGVNVYFQEEDLMIDENSNELETSIITAINQSENERRSENIRLGLKFGAENGSSGLYKKECFGYKQNEKGDLVPDYYQAEVVRIIFKLYLEGLSISGIINKLAEKEIPSPRGCERWSKKSVTNILTNIKYTGNVEVLKADPGKVSHLMTDAHKAIISMEDFEEVQKEIEKRTKRKRKYESSASKVIREIKQPVEEE